MKNTQSLTTVLIAFTIVVVDVAVSFNSALLPNLKGDFAISEQLAQWTIAIAFLSLGMSGICYGLFSENYGRRPVILTGLIIFCLGAFISAAAPNIYILLGGRFIQGFGAGVGWIVGNACLKDIFDTKAYAKVMNQIHAVAGIVPAITPSLGSFLGVFLGWRACFAIIFLLSALTLFLKFRYLPETHLNRHPMLLGEMASIYRDLFKNKQYVKYLIIKAFSVTLLFVEVSNIPLIFVDHLGVPALYYGLYTLPVFCAYIAASYTSSRLSQRIHVDKMLLIGLFSVAVSNVLIFVFSQFWVLSALAIQGFKMLTYMGWGLIFGNATAALISSVPRYAGAASAMMISLEMVFSAIGIYGVGLFFDGTILPVSFFMVGVSLFNILILSCCRRVLQ